LGGEQSNRLGYGRLEETSMRRVCAAVSRKDLAVAEKCRKKSGGTLVSARVAFERWGMQTYFGSKYHNSLDSIYDLKG